MAPSEDAVKHSNACAGYARIMQRCPDFNKLLRPFIDHGALGVVVAGGVLRDLFHDVPVNDIDVFIPHVNGSPQEGLRALKNIFGDDGRLDFVSYSDDIDVLYAFTFPNLSFAPVNFIVVKADVPLTGERCRMDFGLCQVWYDGLHIECTEAFQDDYWNQTFTLKRGSSERDFARSMRRWRRLSQKYPGHTLVIPEEFQQYAYPTAT